MIKPEVLEEVCQGLEELMSKYKKNANQGDKDRLKATKQAHASLRKVILMMAINGDIEHISPIKEGKKMGWMVVDTDNRTKNYC